MKKTLGILFIVLLFSSPVFADTYVITDPYPGGGFNGGPFLINGYLETFCLEISEYFSPGASYYGVINDYAVAGGEAGGKDYLSGKTAHLYLDYIQNKSTIYNTDGNGTDAEKRTAVQLAIWRLEGELDNTYNNYSGLGSTILGLANEYYVWANQFADLNDTGVQVLNIYGDAGLTQLRQSQIYVPEPGTILLLGAGLLGLAFGVRLRKRK